MSSVEVEQGPRWLAELLYGPPQWLLFVVVAAILALGIGLVFAWKKAAVDKDALVEMATNVGVFAGSGTATLLAVEYLTLPYLADVAVGLTAGIALGYGVVQPLGKRYLPTLSDRSDTSIAD